MTTLSSITIALAPINRELRLAIRTTLNGDQFRDNALVDKARVRLLAPTVQDDEMITLPIEAVRAHLTDLIAAIDGLTGYVMDKTRQRLAELRNELRNEGV